MKEDYKVLKIIYKKTYEAIKKHNNSHNEKIEIIHWMYNLDFIKKNIDYIKSE